MSLHLLEGLRKTAKTHSQDGWRPESKSSVNAARSILGYKLVCKEAVLVFTALQEDPGSHSESRSCGKENIPPSLEIYDRSPGL
jgi:hypothetical protein